MSESTKSATKSAAKGKVASAKAKAKAKTKKARGQVVEGKAFIHASFNNTIVTLTDMNGNTLSWSSAGVQGFKGPKKATPYAASMIVKDAVEKAADYGLKEVSVFMSGVGQGREGALRALNANGLGILTIKDVTPIPHNGCRQPRPRRV
ncbi:MAG: 30S ribosomal protein S11 [Candidatus Magasanikbacteria bacterium]|nr:30S ribosomal protein S11 [Candidatus Magasanikbacteria bacterium]MCA9391440.1 30S ribosomal protein S11 [Candidatus Magasanikbacteria bacterium]USN52062.1 MAG: 30S ribosomal protein S11 [Candidatus Nomurabacteria bacterium]HPF95608.1 30S ribosomal protein S11 [bacterium]